MNLAGHILCDDKAVIFALDALALTLANNNITWPIGLRSRYETAIGVLKSRAAKPVEASATDNQQLKAEISALMQALSTYPDDKLLTNGSVQKWLRILSAI